MVTYGNHHSIHRHPQFFGGGVDNADIGLVRNQPIDVRLLQSIGGQRFVHDAAEGVDGHLEDLVSLRNLAIYPNPASSTISVDWERASIKNVELSISTIGGQLVMKQRLTSPRTEVNIHFLQPGRYN